MDPVTIGAAVSAASSAFNLLKQGFAIGRDIEQMSGDLSRWMSAVSDVDHIEKSAKNPSLFLKMTKGKSVESLALQAFTAKKKLEEQRYELKQYISLTMGVKAWDELIRMEGQIRKQRQEAIYAAQQRRQKIIEYMAWTVVIGAGVAVLAGFILLFEGAFRERLINRKSLRFAAWWRVSRTVMSESASIAARTIRKSSCTSKRVSGIRRNFFASTIQTQRGHRQSRKRWKQSVMP